MESYVEIKYCGVPNKSGMKVEVKHRDVPPAKKVWLTSQGVLSIAGWRSPLGQRVPASNQSTLTCTPINDRFWFLLF